MYHFDTLTGNKNFCVQKNDRINEKNMIEEKEK